jgi:Holliday junction resolvase-like predicted endonuclease
MPAAAGAHLFNSSLGANITVTYWRQRNQEVDFVLQQGKTLVALEVKSGDPQCWGRNARRVIRFSRF